MVEKKQCTICNIDVSKSNWSKHLKSKKHTNAAAAAIVVHTKLKRCVFCNIEIPENDWNDHLKLPSHKKNLGLFKKQIVCSNVKRKRKRHFEDIEFETNDYIVKKSEEALEKCFLTVRIIPKIDVDSVDVLTQEFPS